MGRCSQERGRADPKGDPLSDRPGADSDFQATARCQVRCFEVVSHSSLKVEAIAVETSSELLHRADDSTRVIGIDEGQFFDNGLIDAVEQLASAEKQVIVAGLDTDYLRRPFEPIPTLRPPSM